MTEETTNAKPGESPGAGNGQPSSEGSAKNGESATSGIKVRGDSNKEATPLSRWPWYAQFVLALSIIFHWPSMGSDQFRLTQSFE